MFGSVILDVAIGMAYIYLLLSLVASVINEALASLVQSRAANLQRGLRSLLSGDSIESGALSLVDNIYNHGLIRGLYQDPAIDLKDLATNLKDLAIDVEKNPAPDLKKDLSQPGWWSRVRLVLQKLVGIAPGKEIQGVSNPLLLPSYIPARAFALAMIDILNKDKFNGKTPIENIEDFLSSHHQQFENNKAVEALLTLLIDAKNDAKEDYKKLQQLQKNLENWYNDAMDRVSGWYKRYTQNVLMIVGLGLAIAFNVNSVRIAQTLWTDRDARQGMVDAASDYLKNHPAPPVATTPAQGDQSANPPSDGNGKIFEADLAKRMAASVQAVNDVSGKFLLPLGWQHSWSDYRTWWTEAPASMVGKGIPTLIGWLITAGALSLGASFWFDTLNKIMVIRNTVKPQEKSQTEGSKD